MSPVPVPIPVRVTLLSTASSTAEVTALISPSPVAEELRDLAHDARLRQAIVVTAVLRAGPFEMTRGDVFDSAAHDLVVERTALGYSVTLKAAP